MGCRPVLQIVWKPCWKDDGVESKRLSDGIRTGLTNPWHVCPKWHAALTVVIFIIIFISFARPASLYFTEHVYTYMHISDCIQTVYALPLLPNNTASETLLYKSGAM